MSNKIYQTSPDNIRGKLVRFRRGDCLSIRTGRGILAAIITKKFNSYYDLALLKHNLRRAPVQNDFDNGQCFGTRLGSWQDLTYAVDVKMIGCNYVDGCEAIEKVGFVRLKPEIENASYAYLNDLQQLLTFYKEELPVRIAKSRNAEEFPDLAFVSRHLIAVKYLVEHLQVSS